MLERRRRATRSGGRGRKRPRAGVDGPTERHQRRAPGVATAAARPEKGNGDLNSKSTHQEGKQHHCRHKKFLAPRSRSGRCGWRWKPGVDCGLRTWTVDWGLWTEPKFVVQSWNVFYSRFPIPCLDWCSADWDWGAAHCMRLAGREGAWSPASPGTFAPLCCGLGASPAMSKGGTRPDLASSSPFSDDLQHGIKAFNTPMLMKLLLLNDEQTVFEAMDTLILLHAVVCIEYTTQETQVE